MQAKPLLFPLKRLALVCTTAAWLAGCASFTEQTSLQRPLDAQALGLQGTTSDLALPTSQWWTAFGDPQLTRLVDQALAHNPTLAVAQARLARARAASDALRGADEPQAGAGLDLMRQRFSERGMYPPPLAGGVIDSGTLQLSASWELDFFGKNRAALEASLGQVRAAQADAQAARSLLASQVARSYFSWMRLQGQIALAQEILTQRQQLRDLVQSRFQAGLDTQVEVNQAVGNLPEMQLQIEMLEEQAALQRNTLAALVSKPNQALDVEKRAQTAIKNIATGDRIPADLLGRRADIVAARWRVEASADEIKNAKALFYPNVNLVAFAGFNSIGFDKLLQDGSHQWGVGPAVRLPLFESGRLKANLRGKEAEREAAIASYNALVIDALREVSDQISSAQSIARQQVEQQATQRSAEATLQLAQQRQQAGMGTRIQVLQAEAAVLAQRKQALDLTARALDTQVQLIRALGGGFLDEANTQTAAR